MAVIRAPQGKLRVLEVGSPDRGLAALPRVELSSASVDNLLAETKPPARRFDCAVARDAIGDLAPERRYQLLGALWQRAQTVVLGGPLDPSASEALADSGAFLTREGAEVTLVPADKIPVLAAIRALTALRDGPGAERPLGGGTPGEALAEMLDLSLASRWGVLFASNGRTPEALDLRALEWYARESRQGADVASLAVLPLSLEIGRLGGRLARVQDELRERDAALARREAEVRDLAGKVSTLVATATEDRLARRSAEARLQAATAGGGHRAGRRLAESKGRWTVRAHRARAKVRIRTRLRSVRARLRRSPA